MLEKVFAVVGQVLAVLAALLVLAEDLFDENKSMEQRKAEVMEDIKASLTQLAKAMPAAAPIVAVFSHDAILNLLVDKLLPQAEKLRVQLEGPAPANP